MRHWLLLMLMSVAFAGCESTSGVARSYEDLKGQSKSFDRVTSELVESPLVRAGLLNNYRLRCELSLGQETYSMIAYNIVFGENTRFDVGNRRLPSSVYGTGYQTHLVELSRSDLEAALESPAGLRIAAKPPREWELVIISRDLARAFLEDVDLRRKEWINVNESRRMAMLNRSRSMYETRHDDFKKVTWHESGRLELEDNGLWVELYSRVEESGEVYHWIYVSTRRGYSKSWAFFDHAVDSNGERFEVTRKSDVGYGGATYEYLHIPVPIDYLNEYRSVPLKIRLYGSRATKDVTVPAWLIDGYMEILNNVGVSEL